MKNRIKRLSLLSLILFVTWACEFSPSEIPMNELEEPDEFNIPEIHIELTPMMDTLRLSEPIWVDYLAETVDHQIYNIKVELNEVEIGNTQYISAKKIKAYINTNELEDGHHQLKITAYTATNSGSIADKTGNEAYFYELTWPVYVNKRAREGFALKEPELLPEGIKISWPIYDYADFDRYEFSWRYTYDQRGTQVITNPRMNSVVVDSYIEGIYADFSVMTYFKESGFQIDNINYCQPIQKPKVSINSDCTVDLKWEPSENEKEVRLYCLRTSAPVYGIPEEHDVTDLSQTSLRLNEKIGFGDDYQVQLRYIPSWFDTYHSVLNTAGGITSFALGDSIPKFEKAFHVPEENSLLLYNQGDFSKYNLSTGEINQAFSATPVESHNLWTISASPGGIYFGYFENHDYVIRRSSDYSLVNKIDIQAYSGYNLVLYDISLSDNGLVATANHNESLKIYDASTGLLLTEMKIADFQYPRKILLSADGKNLAVMLNKSVEGIISLIHYRLEDNRLIETGQVNGVGKDYWEILAFSPELYNTIVISRWRSMYQYNVELRDAGTFELLQTIEFPSHFVPVAYDFTEDRVIGRYNAFPTKKFSYLSNLATGETKEIVQFTGRAPLIFVNGTVYAGNGRKIKIDNYVTE